MPAQKNYLAMKKSLFSFISALALGLVLTGCSAEAISSDMTELNVSATTIQTDVYSIADLVGSWNMHSMTSEETTVDFDQDGNRTNDLLLETDCFDPMFFDFKSTGEVSTYQSRLFFSEVTGKFSCQTTGNYNATYEIIGDELTVTFLVNGTEYTEKRTISLYTENGSEYLKVTLTKAETNAAVYVAKDPGNTVASDIMKIDMIYKKQ